MFNFRPPTRVPGFRVGVEEEDPGFSVDPDGSVRPALPGVSDAPADNYFPYGDATLASVDPRGMGTSPPDFLQSRPWPARPRLETVPRPDPGSGVAPSPLPLPTWPLFRWPPAWPDDDNPMRRLPPAPPPFRWPTWPYNPGPILPLLPKPKPTS